MEKMKTKHHNIKVMFWCGDYYKQQFVFEEQNKQEEFRCSK